jgi:hypothetical protein
VHWQVYPLMRDVPLVGVVASIAAGLVYWQVVTWTWRAAATGRRLRIGRLPVIRREPVEVAAR